MLFLCVCLSALAVCVMLRLCKWPQDFREAYFCTHLHFLPNCSSSAHKPALCASERVFAGMLKREEDGPFLSASSVSRWAALLGEEREIAKACKLLLQGENQLGAWRLEQKDKEGWREAGVHAERWCRAMLITSSETTHYSSFSVLLLQSKDLLILLAKALSEHCLLNHYWASASFLSSSSPFLF